ncbi:MAG: OmpH family outer membrane protein [Candidatus Omnitrophota bacterium]|nr:OmpH family outer membrane protein [Candidatus Omnitrophota bacterium]
MKKVTAVVLACAFVIGIFAVTSAQAAEKYAYVDLTRIFTDYGKTKEYDKALTDKENAYTTEREKKVTEVKQLQDKMNLLSEKEKAAKKTELDAKIKALQDYDRQRQTDLRKEQLEKAQEIETDIRETVKKIAEKEGYTMVFNDRVLVYQDKALDITDKVMGELGKGYKK